MRFIITAILAASVTASHAQMSERLRIGVDYIQAAARSQALQRTDCERFMLPGDSLNVDQAISEVRAKLTMEDRAAFDKVSGPLLIRDLIDSIGSVTEKNKGLLTALVSHEYACGFLAGQLFSESKQPIARFRALE